MEPRQATQVTTGLVVVAIGVMFLAGQMESGWVVDFRRLWPGIFVVLAVGKFLSRGGLGSGLWFLFLAGIFFLHTFRVLTLRDSWPLFVIAGGISMMFPKREKKSLNEGRSQP